MDGTRRDIAAYETGPSPDFDEFSTVAANSAVTQHVGAGPTVTVSGTPTVDARFKIKIDLGGARGTATFTWSLDGGDTWQAAGVLTAATVLLGSTGVTAVFSVGTYVLNDEYVWTSSGAAELDVSSIGGYPVRVIRVVTAGSGALALRTVGSGATNRSMTGLAAGEDIFPGQITSIRGAGDGTSVTRIRVYK